MTTPTTSMPVASVPTSGTNLIDALSAGVKWGAAGSGAAITYSFPYANGAAVWAAGAAYGSSQNEPDTASGLGTEHQTAARQALGLWADVANLSLVETVESATSVGDIRFAYTQTPAIAPWWGWAAYPSSHWPVGGDVWVNAIYAGADWSVGTGQFSALLHEIGHALGLKHPFEGTPVLPAAQDSEQYTLMSYNRHPHALFRKVIDQGGGSFSWNYYSVAPQTPMLYDIAAIQYLYGPNMSYHAGNDTYTFAPDSPFFKAIWDAGGDDTISIANFTRGCVIDLRAGSFSHISIESDPLPANASGPVATYDGTDNLAIAFGATIENAIGGSGNDSLIGNTADNTLGGDAGADTLLGDDGNDFLSGGSGADTLNGGNGSDTIDYGNATVGINAALWQNTVSNDGTGATDTLVSIENLKGGGFNDFIVGNESANQLEGLAGNDTFYGGGGADTLLGGDGDDFFNGGAGADTLNGGNGTDTIDYGNATVGINAALWQNTVSNDGSGAIDTLVSIENLKGGGFNDFIVGNESANQLEGLAGNDTFYGGGGADTLLGGDGNDFLSGGAGADTLNGGNGTDTIDYGNAAVGISAALWLNSVANDGTGAIDTLVSIENLRGGGFADFIVGDESANQLEGLAGNDTFYGGGGADTLLGGDGNDFLCGGAGADTLNGGNGSDTIDYGNASVGINAALWLNTVSNDGTGAIDTLVSIENLKGGGFNDFIVGNESANRLEGLAGNDTFYGGGGADTLLGGDGNDLLVGGNGSDNLTGGLGADRFDFDAIAESAVGVGRDVITDFSSAQLDRIDLSTLDANTGLANDQAFSYIGNAAFSNVAGQLRFDAGILAGDVNGDGLADFEIQLVGVASLASGDFFL